ncbi:phage tail tape measure protein [Lonsdalea britannica]|uniref:phage tail tape measure protein n=1 Tax=Lonsdalea britannica TaxID=1082704 RepID=UPI000A1E7B08|nr:phage tail tape measure protein [Lonsdalea britannica]OSN07740.1 phage tail tape measure protein [Lonsdalea britannica]
MSDNNLRLQVVMNAIDRITRPLRTARDSTRSLASDIKQTQSQLKQLNEAGNKLTTFNTLKQRVSQTGDALAQARLRAQMMTQEMSSLASPTRAQTKALEDQWRAVSRLENKHQAEQNQLGRLRGDLYRLGISTQDSARATARIAEETARYNRQLSEQTRRLRQAGEQQHRLNAIRARHARTMETRNQLAGNGGGLIATSVTTAAPLMAPVKAYAESEDAGTQLAGAMMGPSATVSPEFEKINRLAVALGDKLPGTTADFQNMMTMLRRQGIAAQTILGGMGEATAYLGVQLKMPSEEAAEFAAKMQDATGTVEKDMMGLMDVIQKGFYAGVDPTNMLQGFTKISSAMDILHTKGLDGAKMLAPFLVMADQKGMAGESAGNAYRKVFQMVMDTKKVGNVNKDLKGSGIKFDFTNGKGEFGGVDQLYRQLDQLNSLNTAKRTQVIKGLFGDDAETLQVINILRQGMGAYQDAQAKLAEQASLRERVDAQLKTLGNKWDAAGGSFTNAMATIGATVAPDLKQLVDGLAELSVKLNEFAKEHPVLTAGLFKAAAGFAIVTGAIGAVMLTIAAILGPMAMMRLSLSMLGIRGVSAVGLIGSALKNMGGAVMWLGRLMMANPILAVIGLIAMGAIYLWQNWDTLGPKFKALWDGICRVASIAWNAICQAVGVAWDVIKSYFMNYTLPGLVYQHWDSIKAGAAEAWEKIKAVVGMAWEGIKSYFLNYTLPGLIYQNWDAIKAGISEAWDNIKRMLGERWDSLLNSVLSLPARFKEAGGKLIDGLMNGISEKWDTLKAKLSSMTDYLPNWMKPDSATPMPLSPAHRPLPAYSDIPMYDTGGQIASGQLGIVGENGPEIVTGPASVTSRRRTAALAAAALTLGTTASPATAYPLHPFSLSPAAPTATTSRQPASIVTPVTVHAPITIVPQPGQSATDIAREVARQLDERERRAQAKARSSYRDQGGLES